MADRMTQGGGHGRIGLWGATAVVAGTMIGSGAYLLKLSGMGRTLSVRRLR